MALSGNGPIDYSSLIQAPDLGGSLFQGFQMGNAVRQAVIQRQQQQQALQAQQQYKTDLQNAFSNPTPQAFAQLTSKYPQQREAFKQSWDLLDKDQQDSQFKAGTEVFSALHNGQPDIALSQLDKHIQAQENSGEDTADLKQIRQQIENDPKAATAHIGLVLSSLDPDRWGKIATEMRASQAAPLEQQKLGAEANKAQAEANIAPERLALEQNNTRANIRNIDSQITDRANRLGLDQDKLQSETQAKLYELQQKAGTLDDGAKSLVNSSTIASVAADQSAQQQLDLATRLEQQGGGNGVFSKAGDFLKNATGNQDIMTNLRSEYMRLRNNQAVRNLPPGSASDADVALAMQGFPPETADSKVLAQFLRGMAKLNQVSATGESAKAEWVNAVGSLGKPKRDIEIAGTKIPAGTTYTEFAKTFIPQKAANRGAEQDQKNIPNRSYMRFANPGAQ